MKKVFLFLILSFLNSCAAYTSGYLPSIKEPHIPHIEPHQEKSDLTFSIDFPNNSDMEAKINLEKTRIKEIKEFFGTTRLFNKIHFVPFNEKGTKHIHFDFVRTSEMPPEVAVNFVLASAYTLTALPFWASEYIDINMSFYVNQKERLALSVAEKEKVFIWLPLIILAPFFNPDSVEARIRDHAFKYFLNEIIEERLYE